MGDEETMEYPAAIDKLNYESSLLAYPNPSSGEITIAIQGQVELGGEVFVYNSTGQMVQKTIMTDFNGVKFSGLAMGNYIAQYRTINELKTVKFTIVD
jgi:hypothetical protein